jgi:hypothetical protein
MSKNKTKSWIAIFFENLVSVRFAVILLFILIPIVIAGSLVPQGRPFAEYAQAYGIKTAEIFHRVYLPDPDRASRYQCPRMFYQKPCGEKENLGIHSGPRQPYPFDRGRDGQRGLADARRTYPRGGAVSNLF